MDESIPALDVLKCDEVGVEVGLRTGEDPATKLALIGMVM
jgi:hypothetical protein